MSSRLVRHDFPADQPRSTLYHVSVDGERIDVLHTGVAAFVSFGIHGPVQLEITVDAAFVSAIVRPLSRGIACEVEGQAIRFTIERPQNLCVEIAGLPELFVYVSAPVPSPSGSHVHCFAGGRLHDCGEIELRSGESVYLEPGAVLRGCIRAIDASDIRIAGPGVLDARPYRGTKRRSILLERCSRVAIDDIVMIEPPSWMIVLGACDDVSIRNVRQIGEVMSSDGIDVCGSTNVRIMGCCLRNNDDCIAIKALEHQQGRCSWARDVRNIRVSGCMLWNARCGNATEIGYELCTDLVEDIRFEDIDVLAVQGHGAPLAIHNGDRATVRNITWRDIRVEHCFDKLIDFRVVDSRYSTDRERGRIRDVLLQNVSIALTVPMKGHSTAIIGGFASDQPVENVTFDNVFLGGRHVLGPDDLCLFMRNVRHIEFR